MRAKLQTLLVLGRVSNLPTVWSNCLAGWYLCTRRLDWLDGGLLGLCAGVSLLYLAGMYLNDAFDVEFDTLHRPERPIPAGRISCNAVGGIGLALTAAGLAVLLRVVPTGPAWSYIFGLAALVWVYNVSHKSFVLAPVLMAGCRVLIYPIAGAAALAHAGGNASLRTSLSVAALAMGTWILTLSLLARTESTGAVFRQTSLALLAAPILIWVAVAGKVPPVPLALLVGWIMFCLSRLQRTGRTGAAVGDLLAGIPLVDLLAVASPLPRLFSPPVPYADYLPSLVCMALALILRRSIPPT